MAVPIGIWASFVVFVFLMLALDLGVFHRKAHKVEMKEALVWSGVWIGLALVFNAGLYFFWDKIQPGSRMSNEEAGLGFLAGYLVEKALSIDNIFVFLLIFSYFKVPEQFQHRVLFWGIFGALVFRAIFIALGAALLENFFWVTVLFGVFLVATGIKMAMAKEKKLEPDKNPLVRLLRRLMPVTTEYAGANFFTRIDRRLWATPLLVVLLLVEFSDIVFAVDSIPAIFAITTDPFLVFTSNVFAILGLRALFFALSGLMQMFHYLSYGLAAVLIFVGFKMLYAYAEKALIPEWPKFPVPLSLGVIVGILAIAILASIRKTQPLEVTK